MKNYEAIYNKIHEIVTDFYTGGYRHNAEIYFNPDNQDIWVIDDGSRPFPNSRYEYVGYLEGYDISDIVAEITYSFGNFRHGVRECVEIMGMTDADYKDIIHSMEEFDNNEEEISKKLENDDYDCVMDFLGTLLKEKWEIAERNFAENFEMNDELADARDAKVEEIMHNIEEISKN